jgi:hypothetical protein
VGASLVDGDGQKVRVLAHDLDELLDLVVIAHERCGVDAQLGEQRGDVGRGDRELRLRDGPPLLQPVVVDLLEALHVQHPASNLDARLAATRDDVLLVAFAHARWLERGQPLFRLPECLAERPPLPPRDDHPGVGSEDAARGAERPLGWPDRRSKAFTSSVIER